MDKISVAAAPNLSGIIEEIINNYEDKSVIFDLTVGENCGIYYREIVSGGSYDIFLGADEKSVDNLVFIGLALKTAIYAKGKLCLWPKTNEINLCNLKIAIPDPSMAPYGKAAYGYLENKNLIDCTKQSLLLGKNPFEVSNLVKEHKADIAFLPVSFVRSVLKDNDFILLEDGYKPVIQKVRSFLKRIEKQKSFLIGL